MTVILGYKIKFHCLNYFLETYRQFNALAVKFFTYPPIGTEIIFFLHIFTWHRVFSIFTVWQRLFSLVLTFPRLKIEAPPRSIIQYSCLYNIFKAENQETQFPLLCTQVFFFSRMVVPIMIYRPFVPSMYY